MDSKAASIGSKPTGKARTLLQIGPGGYGAKCSAETMTSQVMQVSQGRDEEAKG